MRATLNTPEFMRLFFFSFSPVEPVQPVHRLNTNLARETWVEPAQPKIGNKTEVGILGQFWAV